MSEYQKRKQKNYKGKRSSYKKTPFNRGVSGGGRSYRPKQPQPPIRHDNGYRNDNFMPPKQEKSHWNGKVEPWTEPQKPPKQEKIVRYEVDTDKLLRDLAKGNKEALNEIVERLKEETNTEIDKEQQSEAPQKTNNLEKATEIESDKSSVPDEDSKTQVKEIENETQQKAQEVETSVDIEPVSESNPNDNPLEAPELKYMDPSFWQGLENELSEEIKAEPKKPIEPIPQEVEPINEEGY